MSEYMKEVERLAHAYADAKLVRYGMNSTDPLSADPEQAFSELIAHIQRGAVLEGWKEATIAWEVCASIHREYAKKKDPFFTTRQADFVKHTEAARAAMLAAAPAPDHFRDAAEMAPAPAGVPMPKPDTHCYDEDERRDVWSHSADQMRTELAVSREREARMREAVRGLLDALPSATTHPAIKAARAALAEGAQG